MGGQDIKTKSPHILVIEDGASTRSEICQFLNNKHWSFSLAENGRHAIELLSFFKLIPDIILIDADMTQMSGFDTALAIQRQKTLEHIPILMITSSNNASHIDRALAVGASDYIAKPINWNILNNRLRFLWQTIQDKQLSNLASIAFQNTNHGMTITDSEQTILARNEAFSQITGYDEDEVLGETPRVLQSGKNDVAFYQKMWKAIMTDGKWEGKIWNKRKSGEIYPEWLNVSAVKNENGLISNYIGTFSDISSLIEQEQHLHRLAHYDNLTGLANRLLFNERLGQAVIQAKRSRKKVGLLYIDLDDFKPVNDKYGHGAGDIVLKTAAQRLEKSIRRIDTACRLGGDEFAIILNGIYKVDEAANIARKVIHNITQPISINKTRLSLGCSIGVSVFPDHSDLPNEMIQQADTAMYKAKQKGKNQFYLSQKRKKSGNQALKRQDQGTSD